MAGLLRLFVVIGIFCAGLCSNAAVQAAIVAPYTNGFTVDEPFTEAVVASTSWTLNTGGTGTYTNSITAATTTAASTTAVTNLGGLPASATGFVMSSKFTITANSGATANNTVGFAALSSAANPTNNWLLADIGTNGNAAIIRLLRFDAGGGTTTIGTSNSVPAALTIGTEYTMTLTANYVSSNLNLLFELYNGASLVASTSGTVLASDVTTNLTGNNFGLRNRTNAGTPFTVAFNDFSIVTAVPEPGTWLAGGMTLAGFLFYRRRRTAA